MGIRLVVVDDNPHVAWEGRTYPVNATFQQFVSGVLDLPGSPVASVTSVVPLRDAHIAPGSAPLDPRIRVVGSTPFDGIGGYLRHGPAILAANRPILRRALATADLLWLKVPASNAALAASLATTGGVPRFVWVAGSAADVAVNRFKGPRRMAGWLTGATYDVVGRLAGLGGERLIVGEDIVDGAGIVATLVEPDEVRETRDQVRPWPPERRVRMAWAGRLVAGKGIEALLETVAADAGLELDLLGNGPDEDRLRTYAATVGAAPRVSWAGRLAERTTYLDRLAEADAFAFPSPAEGFPKVVLDAFAVGIPVLATRTGALAELAEAGLVEPVAGPTARDLAAAWQRLRARRAATVASRVADASSFARRHTRHAEAARLVGRWQDRWPELPWASDGDGAAPTA